MGLGSEIELGSGFPGFLVCQYRVDMQAQRKDDASAPLVFLHQSQNEGAALRIRSASVHLGQNEVELWVLPEPTWTNTFTNEGYDAA